MIGTLLVAPLAAWLVSTIPVVDPPPVDTVTPATNDELLAAIRADNNLLPEDNRLSSIDKIVSVKKIDAWWYVVVVEARDAYHTSEAFTAPVIAAKYNNTAPINVVTTPGNRLPYVNISGGQGVPYSAIDYFNTLYDEHRGIGDSHE